MNINNKYLINLYAKDGKIDSPEEKQAFANDMKSIIAEVYGKESDIYKGIEQRFNNSVFDIASKSQDAQFSIDSITGNKFSSKIELNQELLENDGVMFSKDQSENEIDARRYFVAGTLVHELEHSQQIESDYLNFKAKFEKEEGFQQEEFDKMYKYMFNNQDELGQKKFLKKGLIENGVVQEQELSDAKNQNKIKLYEKVFSEYEAYRDSISPEVSAYKVENNFFNKVEEMKKDDKSFNKEYFNDCVNSTYVGDLRKIIKKKKPEEVDNFFAASLSQNYIPDKPLKEIDLSKYKKFEDI